MAYGLSRRATLPHEGNDPLPYRVTAAKTHTSHSLHPVTRMECIRSKAAAQNFRDLPKRTNVFCRVGCIMPFLNVPR